MALKYNTNNVSDVVWHANNQDYVVTVVKQNNTVVYARPGTYVTGTLPEHVTSLAATRAATIEPTASTGSIASGGTVYHGDTLNFVAVPETYWTMTYDTTHTINFLSTKSVSGVNAANIRQIMGLERNFKYRCDGALVETLNITYKDRYGNATTLTRGNATNYYKNVTVGQPFAITYDYTIRQYYTCTITASNLGASDQEAVIYFGNTTALPRTFNYTLNDGVYRITTYYTNGSVAWSMTSSGSQTAEQPTSYTFGAVAATYWTNATVSPTQTGAGAATVNIVGTALPYMLNANVNIGSGVSQITYTYSSTPTKRSTVTTNANASFNAWTGGSIEYSGTRSTYWTNPTSGTIDPSTSIRSVTVSGQRYMQNVPVTWGDNISSVTVTYKDSSNATVTSTLTSQGSVSAWTGEPVTWSAVAATYWTTTAGGTINATEGGRSINAGNASRRPRNLYLNPSAHAIITASYTNTNNSAASLTATRTNNSAANLWQGSGVDATLAVDTYCTGSLNATHANAGTSDVYFNASVEGLTKTFAVQIKSNGYSDVSVTRYNSNFSPTTFTPNTVWNTYSVWQGGPITYTYNFSWAYYTPSITASNLGAGTGYAELYFDAVALNRIFYYVCGDGVSKIRSYTNSYSYVENTDGTNRSVWQGHNYTFGAVASTYWTNPVCSPTKADAGSSNVTITGTASRYMKDATVYIGSGVSKITVTYSDSAGTRQTAANQTASKTVNAWTGASIEYSGVRSTYWTDPTSGTLGASENDRSVTVNASPYVRSVTVNLGNTVTLVTVTYQTTAGASAISTSLSSSGSINAWTGSALTWSGTALLYWTMDSSGGTIAASESARTITASASRYMKDATVSVGAGVATITVTYSNASNNRITVTTNTHATVYAWTGETIGYSGSRQTYWTNVSSGTLSKTISNRSVTVSASRYMKDVSVTLGSHINKVIVTYSNSSGSSVSASFTSAGSVNAWTGQAVTWSCSVDDNWTATSGGSVAASEGARAINTGDATRWMYTITLSPAANSTMKCNYYDSNGNQQTNVSTSPVSAWKGSDFGWYVLADTYWTYTSGASGGFTVTQASIVYGPSPTRQTALFAITRGDGVDTIKYTYTDASGTRQTVTTNTNGGGTAWCGGTIEYSGTRLTYWTDVTSGTAEAATGPRLATVSAGRYMKNVGVTLNSNVSKITVTYANNSGTSVSSTFTANGNANAWTGAKVTWAASASTYWTMDTGSGTLNATESDRSISPTASRYMKNATVYIGSGVSKITVTYSDASGNRQTAADQTASKTVYAWTGETIGYSGVRSTYWTDPSSGSLAVSTGDRSVTVNASRYMRNVAVTLGSNVSKITLTYSNSSGTETSTDVTTTGNVSAWTGARIKWVATAAQYWTISNSGETAATESARSINTGNATRAARTVNLYPSAHAIITASYTNTNNSSASVTATRTNNSASNVWQGSGIDATLAVDTYCTGSLSATHANAGTGDVAFTANVSGLTKTFAVQIKNGNAFSNVSVTRYSSDFSAIVFTPNGVYNTYAVWQGGPITYTYTWTGDQWVTANITATNLGAGTGTATLFFDTKSATRVFNYSSSTGHITKIKTYRTYTYYYDNVPGTSRTIDSPAEWYTFSAVADSYWTVSSVSPTKVEAGLTTVNIDATASKLTRVIKFTPYGFWTMGGGSATITYVSPTGTATTNTTTVLSRTGFTTTYSLSVWQGGTVSVAVSPISSSWEVTGNGTSFDPGSASQSADIGAWLKPSDFWGFAGCSLTQAWSTSTNYYVQFSITNYTQYSATISLSDIDITWPSDYRVGMRDASCTAITIQSGKTGTINISWPLSAMEDVHESDYGIYDAEQGYIELKATINGTGYTDWVFEM